MNKLVNSLYYVKRMFIHIFYRLRAAVSDVIKSVRLSIWARDGRSDKEINESERIRDQLYSLGYSCFHSQLEPEVRIAAGFFKLVANTLGQCVWKIRHIKIKVRFK